MTRGDRWLKFTQTLRIRTRDRRIIPLTYNKPQQIVWAKAKPLIDTGTPIRFIVLKARRHGVSTEIESWMMAFVASSNHVNALITAHQSKAAKRIWNMSKLFVNSSPLLRSMATFGKNQIIFGNSILEVSTAASPEAERSADVTAAHFSEVAFWEHPEAMLATMQTLPPPSVFSIAVSESTPNGKVGPGQLFYEEWKRAEEGESDWTPIFLPFHIFEDNQLPGIAIEEPDAEEIVLRNKLHLTDAYLAWRRWAIVNLCQNDLQKFHQEYPATAEEAFIQSGLPFFRNEHLLPMEADVKRGVQGTVTLEGKFERSPTGYLTIYVPPLEGHKYVLGADSSFGIEDDDELHGEHSRSAGEIIDMETQEQVAEYDAVSAPHVMARHLVGMGRLYNTALIAPEVQASGGGGGREIIVYLRGYEYWNIHRWKHVDHVERDAGKMFGWETNARTRPRMLARIREVVMEHSAVVHSRRLLNQLASFGESDSGRMEALAGHDDLIFAWGIALMSRSENYYRMPSDTGAQGFMGEPDWQALGLHVIKEETPEDRFRRLLVLADQEPAEKDFMAM